MVISSPLNGEEVAERLDAVTYSWAASIWYSLDSRRDSIDRRRLYGRVGSRRLRVARFRGWRIHNSWVPFFSAQMRSTPLGTIIEGKVGIHPWPLAVGYAFSAVLTFFWLFAPVEIAQRWGEEGPRALVLLLGPLGLSAFGAALTWFGHRLTLGDDVWLLEYVAGLLEGQVFDPK